ncbi:tartrate dehydrogenase [Falsiroseomonas sp. E2-1-a20]|uniref:tartrate dehydrogenase n=1 Tax=Falsiroseomonas sp. E2-1-a20 TaxID=3239300 RepID=UPI003F3AF5AF
MRRHRIAAIGGDGIGPEVVAAGLRVLEATAEVDGGFGFDVRNFDWGSDHYRRTGRMMPEDGLAQLAPFDAIFFGAVGDKEIPDHITLWELRLAICQGFDQYANVRPTKLLPGIVGPLKDELGRAIDWVIVRENSEGEYAGVGGRAHRGLPLEVGMDVAVFTRAGVERIARFACDLAMTRPRKKLTVVTKSNAQRHGLVLWDEVCAGVTAQYPELEVDKMLVDAMAARMVVKPGSVDTVLATNLHADILSDLASACAGSLGIGATANLDPSRKNPSMFEPIHGSAFDIVGKGVANPLGSFWTGAMMLEHLGEATAAQRLMAAVASVTAKGEALTPDLGGGATTDQTTEAVIAALRGANL